MDPRYSASHVYGTSPSVQPTASPVPEHAPGTPAPVARTRPLNEAKVGVANPVLVLVVIVGLALFLGQLSIRLDVRT